MWAGTAKQNAWKLLCACGLMTSCAQNKQTVQHEVSRLVSVQVCQAGRSAVRGMPSLGSHAGQGVDSECVQGHGAGPGQAQP